MKNIIFFISLLMLISCGSNPLSTSKKGFIKCPTVLFAAEHKKYLKINASAISVDDVAYKAEINNYNFSKGCFINDNNFNASLSILFIVKPLIKEQNIITLPFYLAILDKEKKLRDIQYYYTEGNFNKNLETETKEFVETDLSKTITINIPDVDEMITIVVGFMLDKQQLEILN